MCCLNFILRSIFESISTLPKSSPHLLNRVTKSATVEYLFEDSWPRAQQKLGGGGGGGIGHCMAFTAPVTDGGSGGLPKKNIR